MSITPAGRSFPLLTACYYCFDNWGSSLISPLLLSAVSDIPPVVSLDLAVGMLSGGDCRLHESIQTGNLPNRVLGIHLTSLPTLQQAVTCNNGRESAVLTVSFLGGLITDVKVLLYAVEICMYNNTKRPNLVID